MKPFLKETILFIGRVTERTSRPVERFLEYTVERRLLRLFGWLRNPLDPESVGRYVVDDTKPLHPRSEG